MRMLVGLVVIAACNSKSTTSGPSPAALVTSGSGSARSGAGSGEAAWIHDPPEVLREKLHVATPHVLVLKTTASFAEYRDVLGVVEKTPGVVAAEPFLFAEIEMAKPGKPAIGVALKGVDPARVGKVLALGRVITAGTLDSLATKSDPPGILLGDVLAKKLDVALGDEVAVTPPASPAKPMMFEVTGTFHVGFDEHDERLAFASLGAVQAAIGRGDEVMGVEMTVTDVDGSDKLAKDLEAKLGAPYRVMDWYELNKLLFTKLYGDARPRMKK